MASDEQIAAELAKLRDIIYSTSRPLSSAHPPNADRPGEDSPTDGAMLGRRQEPLGQTNRDSSVRDTSKPTPQAPVKETLSMRQAAVQTSRAVSASGAFPAATGVERQGSPTALSESQDLWPKPRKGQRNESPSSQESRAAASRSSSFNHEKSDVSTTAESGDIRQRMKLYMSQVHASHASKIKALLSSEQDIINQAAQTAPAAAGPGASNSETRDSCSSNALTELTSPLAQLEQDRISSPHEQPSRLQLHVTVTDGYPHVQELWAPAIEYSDDQKVVPRYWAYTSVKNNVLSENNNVLRFMPYFGSDDEGSDGDDNLGELYEDKAEELSKRYFEEEQAAWCFPVLEMMLQDYDCTVPETLGAILNRALKLQRARQEPIYPRNNGGLNFQQKMRLISACPGSEAAKSMVADYMSCPILFRTAAVSLWKVLVTNAQARDILRSVTLTELESKNTRDHTRTWSALSSMRCAICLMHECSGHGEYVKNNIRKRVLAPHSLNLVRLNKASGSQKSAQAAKQDGNPQKFGGERNPCSEQCFLRAMAPCETEPPWSDADTSLLKSTLSAWRSCETASCAYTMIISKPCNEIHAKIQALEATATPPPTHALIKQPTSKINWRETKTFRHDKRKPFTPCDHPGTCMKHACSCFNAKVACEKLCRCRGNCRRAFQGCSCNRKGKVCRTDRCECYALNRECDADLCGTCGAAEILDPSNRGDESILAQHCGNVNLQKGVPKRTLLGTSEVQGYGLFMGEAVKAGEFLGEYVGDVLSSAEAERRGAIYNRQQLSYLFTLNKAQTIDATRAGNKLRFVNHSHSAPNCAAKILFVNGVQRIAMFSLRTIEAGEELFFDYGREYHTTFLSKEPKGKGGKRGHLGTVEKAGGDKREMARSLSSFARDATSSKCSGSGKETARSRSSRDKSAASNAGCSRKAGPKGGRGEARPQERQHPSTPEETSDEEDPDSDSLSTILRDAGARSDDYSDEDYRGKSSTDTESLPEEAARRSTRPRTRRIKR